MKRINKLIGVIILLSAAQMAGGQSFYDNYFRKPGADTIPGTIRLSLYNNNFIKNNEYFGPYTEGITYIGSILQPEITWALAKNFSLSGGWYFRQFYGHDGFEQFLPVIRATYRFAPGLRVIVGQLEGRPEHRYIEPIYSTDNYFTRNPEYGVQFRADRQKARVDVYMDWEKFILPGQASQEIITGGLLASWYMNGNEGRKGLSGHFQSVIHHYGGQVDASSDPLQSRANLAAGLSYSLLPDTRMVRSLLLESWYIQAAELSQTNTLPYESGFGTLNQLSLKNDWVNLSSGWFHGEYFFAPMGDYLYQSVSQFNSWYTGETRDLITSKIMVSHSVMNGVNFALRFESYYDLKRKAHDYSYGLNISVNTSVFEHSLRRN
jgi:hypothetical protein